MSSERETGGRLESLGEAEKALGESLLRLRGVVESLNADERKRVGAELAKALDAFERRVPETSKAERRLGLALEAGRMGTWEWSLATRRVTWSSALERLHGIPEGSFGGTFEAYQQDIHPEDRERVLNTIHRTMELKQDHRLEYRIVRPDGAVRWLEASGQVLLDGDGNTTGMMGVCADVTERKTADIALRASEAWFSTTLSSIGDAVIATDALGRVSYMNPVAEQLTGWTLENAKQRSLVDVFRIINEHTREVVESPVDKVLREGNIVGLANHTILMRADGSELGIDDSAAPIRDPGGAIVGVVMVFRDVTEKRLEDARQTFLREATRLMASSLDAEQAVATLATLAVPRIADWCGVDILDEEGTIRRLAVAHVDPEKVELAHELHRRYPPDPNAPYGVPHVLRTGDSELVPEIPDELLVSSARDAEHLEIARQLGLRSYMVVPIRASTGILGAVSFVTAEAKRRLTQDDLVLAEQLCDCAAIAMSNARLYRSVQQARADAETTAARILKLQQVTAALASTTSPKEVADVAMDHAFRHLQAAASVLYTCVDGAFRLLTHRGLPPSVERWRLLPVDASLPLATAIRSKAPQWLESHEALLEAYPNLASTEVSATKLQSVIALPLMLHGAVVGGLAFSFHEPRRFSPHERDMLVSTAAQIAQSLERTRLREAERIAQAGLQEREARYRYIFDAAAVGIAEKDYTAVKRRLDALVASGLTDLRGYLAAHPEFLDEAIDLVRVRDVNPAMMRLFEAEEKSQLFDLRSIFLPESRALFVEELIALMDGTRIVSGEVSLRTLRDTRITVLSTVAFPVSGCDRVLISRTDITEHKRMLEEREHLVEKLTATVRMNEMFAAILGHDLRNPLGAVLTSAELAIRRSQDDNVRRPLGRILTSGERMARMIDQLLDFSRARAGGGIAVELREMELGPLCKQIVGELQDANPKCPLRLEVSGDTHGAWDQDRIAQVISNLAGNACQHRAPNTPVMVDVDGSDARVVVLRVSNKGEIPPDILPLLFDPFRGAQQPRHRAQGLGLGLFISEQIVVAHRGSIEVSSVHGETTMAVRLPRRANDGHG